MKSAVVGAVWRISPHVWMFRGLGIGGMCYLQGWWWWWWFRIENSSTMAIQGPQRPAQATLHNWSPGPHLLQSREEQASLVNSSKWGPLVSSQTPPTFFILLSLPTHCCSPQQQLSMLVRSHLSSPWTTAVPLFLHPHNYLFSLAFNNFHNSFLDISQTFFYLPKLLNPKLDI